MNLLVILAARSSDVAASLFALRILCFLNERVYSAPQIVVQMAEDATKARRLNVTPAGFRVVVASTRSAMTFTIRTSGRILSAAIFHISRVPVLAEKRFINV